MDIASKYRTKCPPREHEEAVRMLLEGIGKHEAQIVQENSLKEATIVSSNSYDYDERSIHSSLSPSSIASSDGPIDQSASINNKYDGPSGNTIAKHQHSGGSNSSSSGIDHDAMFREPIPSRTIAVQCDLKSSSIKRSATGGGGENLIDGSAQASSISSTRYGFYNFTPEALEMRRKMQRSASNRDLARSQNQIETPTSMSELSVSDNELNNRQHETTRQPASHRSDTHHAHNGKKYSAPSSSSYSSSSHSAHAMHRDHPMARPKSVTQAAGASGGAAACRTRLLHHQQRSAASTADDSSTARAKINSLPRRPVTALSYVSTTKLRDHRSPDRELTDERPIKSSRAMSQQTLASGHGRSRTPAPERLASSTSCSDSDCADGLPAHRRRSRLDDDQPPSGSASDARRSGGRRAPPAQPEQAVVGNSTTKNTLRTELSPAKPPRPTLVYSKHEEQVRDYKTLERQAPKPSALRDSYDSSSGASSRNNGRSASHKQYSSRAPEMTGSPYRSRLAHQHQDENEEFDKFATVDRGAPDDRKDPYEAEYSSRLRSRQQQPAAAMMRHGCDLAGDSSLLRESAYHQASKQDYLHNSMSLSRRLRPIKQHTADDRCITREPEVSNGYYTASRIKPHKLSRADRAFSQSHLPKSYALPTSEMASMRGRSVKQNPQVVRSTSMRQIDRPISNLDRCDPNAYATLTGHRDLSTDHNGELPEMSIHQADDARNIAFKNSKSLGGGRMYATGCGGRSTLYRNQDSDDDEDSESPMTRTWANPSVVRPPLDGSQTMNNRKSSRSYSMRDIDGTAAATDFNANTNRYEDAYGTKVKKNDLLSYNSSSESSYLETAQRFARQHPLDYDSQHRLNEIGLPEVNPVATQRRTEAPGSYLGASGSSYRDSGPNASLYTNSRAPQITGRAMSQQSLTRPTMPLMSSRRRAGGSNHSGSDVGGSSMSLVSRLHGRYENAHTRTPVVMYIPKAMPRASSHGDGGISLIGKSSTLRKSSRSRQKSSSQERSKRSLSRNGSDSESSSMLRTLVRPRSRLQANNMSKRTSRMQHSTALYNNEDEDIDGVGQLASEMDSYKFKRRYSVPKDAKINWFAKLKQRVSSSNK